MIRNYAVHQLLVLGSHCGATIYLAKRPRSGKKHPNQMGSDASYLITEPITPYNGTAVENVSIGLINCHSICNKCDILMLLRICVLDMNKHLAD